MRGLVFDIKRFAIHDGDGIRTTVFFKGCPLRCVWCQNPEGLQFNKKLWYFSNRCLHCHQCIQACPQQALKKREELTKDILIDYNNCDNCGICTEVCPTNALSFDSKWYSLDELVAEIIKDKDFFEISGGGVTASGGDPVFQHEFVTAFLLKCKEQGVQTTLESSMYASIMVVEKFLPIVDKFIVDLKIFDSESHKRATGQRNDIIKQNIEFLIAANVDLLIRIPLIPNYTANEKNIREIYSYIHRLSPKVPIELLNFNNLARNKYEMMNLSYPFPLESKPFTKIEMERFNSIINGVSLL